MRHVTHRRDLNLFWLLRRGDFEGVEDGDLDWNLSPVLMPD